MTEETMLKTTHIVVSLITGETLLASCHNIANWDEGKVVTLIEPLSVIPTLLPEKFTLSFCKKLLFTHEKTLVLKSDAIQSYSYMDTKSFEFYRTALEYFENTVDPVIEKELDKYTKLLKDKKEGVSKETMDRIKAFLQEVYGSNTATTIH